MGVQTVKPYNYDPVIAGKNFLINGGFDFTQRTTSPTTPLMISSGNGYVADRWTTHQFQTALHSRTSITPGSGPISQFALRVGSPTTAQAADGSRMVAAQMIESNNTYFLRNQTITLSFWVRFSSAQFLSIANAGESAYNEFGIVLGFMTTTTDSPIGSTAIDSQIFSGIANGSLPTVWTKYTITTVVPSSANNIIARFGFGARGSTAVAGTNWYEIADVQVEENNYATMFSRAGGNYIEELRLCQRYYYRTSATNLFSPIGFGFASSTTNAMIDIKFPVQMRVAPTLVGFSTLQVNDSTTGITVTAVAYNGTEFGISGATVNCTVSGGLTQFRPCKLLANNSTLGYIDFSAEI